MLTSDGNQIKLRPAQGTVFTDPHRFVVLLAGRRFGKTILALVKLLAAAAERPSNYYYLAPTYRMAKAIAWRPALKLYPESFIKTIHRGDLMIEFKNGSILEFKGADNPDSLRGPSLGGAVLDEAAFMADTVWEDIISPALADQEGWGLFITTPSPAGTAGWFYDICLQLLEPDACDPADIKLSPEHWAVHQYTTLQGGNVSKKEVERAQRELDPNTFRREYLAELFSNAGLVASCFSPDNISRDAVDAPELPLYIGMDFNATPLTAICSVISDNTLWVHDEITLEDATTWDMAEEILRRYGESRRIVIYPDPTGARRQTSSIGVSDHKILRRYGLEVVAPRSPWNVKDKIAAVNAAFRTADGFPHCFVHPSCKELLKSLRSLGYQEGSDAINKKLGVDHAFDALGYLCLGRFNMASPSCAGQRSKTLRVY